MLVTPVTHVKTPALTVIILIIVGTLLAAEKVASSKTGAQYVNISSRSADCCAKLSTGRLAGQYN